MKTLHTISKTPTSNLLTSCLEAIAEDDGVLFLEDGVYYVSVSYTHLTLPTTPYV